MTDKLISDFFFLFSFSLKGVGEEDDTDLALHE